MKRTILTALILFAMSGLLFADGIPPGNSLVLSAAYQAVSTTNKSGVIPFTIWTSDGSTMWVSHDLAGTKPILIPADTTPLCVYSNKAYTGDGVLCYVKAVTGTPTLYISTGPPE